MEINTKEELNIIDKQWKSFKFKPEKIQTLPISNFISDEHIDIIIKYLYIKSYVEKNNSPKYKKMYEKMQNNRIGECQIKEFDNLIESFKKNGFLKEFPIPINKKNKMLNGSHRLACCLYFNINPYVVIFNKADHSYGIEWFKNNGFSTNELNEIINTKNYLLQRYTESSIKLENIYSAMISPVLKNKTLDYDYFKSHANYLFDNGIKGLFLCGNTGAGMKLSLNIKKKLLDEAIHLEKFSIICHIGCETRKETFEFVKYTNKCDIKCIASMPPYKYINSFKDIKIFYEQLAKVSKKPLIIYHIPSITGINLTDRELIELLKINNVIGIKYTDNDMEKLKSLSIAMPKKYIFFGRDDLLLDGINNGATGGIGGCYNLFPSYVYNIINNQNPKDNQEKLNYCIKKLRKIYPELPGSEFVLKSLEIKKNMTDNEFLKYLEGEQ